MVKEKQITKFTVDVKSYSKEEISFIRSVVQNYISATNCLSDQEILDYILSILNNAIERANEKGLYLLTEKNVEDGFYSDEVASDVEDYNISKEEAFTTIFSKVFISQYINNLASTMGCCRVITKQVEVCSHVGEACGRDNQFIIDTFSDFNQSYNPHTLQVDWDSMNISTVTVESEFFTFLKLSHKYEDRYIDHDLYFTFKNISRVGCENEYYLKSVPV